MRKATREIQQFFGEDSNCDFKELKLIERVGSDNK